MGDPPDGDGDGDGDGDCDGGGGGDAVAECAEGADPTGSTPSCVVLLGGAG